MSIIQVGNAPCSWGTLEFGSTKADRITYETMLDELVASGYTGSELGDWGFMPTEPDALLAAFKARDLSMTGAFMGFPFRDATCHAAAETEALKIARQIAGLARRLGQRVPPFAVLADDNGTDPVRTKNAGRVTDDMTLSPAEWETFAAGVNRVARAIHAETGLHSVIHHHCGGFIETPDEIAEILARTDPEVVGLVFDTGHYAFGDGTCGHVLDGLNRFRDRIWYVHFKDCRPDVMAQTRVQEWDYFEAIEHGIFCELGQGCVDFPAVVQWLHETGYTGFITVEQDVLPGLGTPLASNTRNRSYLRSIGI